MKLIVVHHHFRPGGVRRVIELATPHLVEHFPEKTEQVLLTAGEAPDAAWLRNFRQKLGGTEVEVRVEPAFGYVSEQGENRQNLRRDVSEGVRRLLREAGQGARLIWAHNLGLGRNPHLSQELTSACRAANIPLVAHHHDWWFENRWHHFAEMRQAGFRTLRAMATAVFETGGAARHVAINQSDATVLARHFPGQSGWLPNLMEPEAEPGAERRRFARAWLRRQLGEDAPVWLLPCRLLRRKNIAEALLLTRWLRPEAWLVTTGGVSSADEEAYAEALSSAARAQGWRLRLGVLAGDESRKPTMVELLAASEAVLLTSLQEGFGLPYLEAASAGRPLIARQLPNVAPDLATFGFDFPQSYDELLVDPKLFDWRAEQERQARHFKAWRKAMPRAAARFLGCPALLEAGARGRPVSFARLTLAAQLEVLAQPVERSWESCAPLNRLLRDWRDRAARGALAVSPWPRSAREWLSGEVYARRFIALVNTQPSQAPPRDAAQAVQRDFLRKKLKAGNLYPLLWDRNA